MEKRANKRISASLSARFTLDGKKYAGSLDRLSGQGIKWHDYTGVIENLSKSGIYMRTSPADTSVDFSPGTELKLEFQILTGETFDLNCKVRWINETQHRIGKYGITRTQTSKYTATGMEIITPSLKYKEFIKTRLKQHK